MFTMKHFIALAIAFSIIVFSATCLSQEQSLKKKDVPKVILDTFHKSYPKADIKGYSKESENGNLSYEIESLEGKTHRDVSYSADGSVVSVEESMVFSDLPEPIRDAIKKDYPKAKVSMCEKVVEGNTTTFELVVRSGRQKYELVFNAEGTLLKQEKK